MAQVPQRALRLLIVTADKYPPFRVDVTVLFGEELSKRGHRMDWIMQSEQPCAHAYVADWGAGRVWVGRTDNGSSRIARLRKHVLGIVHAFRILQLARKGRYDVVQVKDKVIAALPAWIAARRTGANFVFWLSFPFAEASLAALEEGCARYPVYYLVRGWILKLLLYRVILRLADHIFVQSEQMKRDVAAQGIDPRRMTAVPMGISLRDFQLVEGGRERVQRERSICYLGTLGKIRRIDFLIRVLALVRARCADVRLYLVGEGDDPADRDILLAEAHRLAVEDAVTITGFLPGRKHWNTCAGRPSVCLLSIPLPYSTPHRPPSWSNTWPWAARWWQTITQNRSW